MYDPYPVAIAKLDEGQESLRGIMVIPGRLSPECVLRFRWVGERKVI